MAMETNLFINGEYVEPSSGERIPVVNPATNEMLAEVASAGEIDIYKASLVAHEAFNCGPWPKMKNSERSKILKKMAELIVKEADFLGELECLNVGKLLKDCKGHDIPRGAESFTFFAEKMERLAFHWEGSEVSLPKELKNRRWVDELFYKETEFLGKKFCIASATVREPAGVCGLIVPWNSPFMLGSWKLGAALAAGNTCVLKPAEWAPLTLLQLGRIANEAGLPQGVLNIVPGLGSVAGASLIKSSVLNRISFTGSVGVGKEIMRVAANRLTKISLELGGKAPNIVFPDIDIPTTVEAAARSIFRSQGQSCVAGSRLFLHEDIYEEFLRRLIEKAEAMKIGNPLDPTTELGPVITKTHKKRVEEYVKSGISEGARLLTNGLEGFNDPALQKGNYLRPTIFDNARHDMKIASEEIFGPVLVVFKFRNEEEVLLTANSTRFGLSASIWTNDMERALRVASRLESGMIWINGHFLRDLRAPFGGVKESGYGREGGKYSLEFYTEPKMICIPVK